MTTTDAESKASRPRTPRLRLVEKRSIVYARLPAEVKSFQPDQVVYIPHATMAWIESLLKRGSTDWLWFAAILKFINSNAYREIESSLIYEIGQMRAEKKAFYEGFKSPSSKVPSSLMVSFTGSVSVSWPNARPNGDRHYFRENIDTLWWRDQE
jgi:hypothetical protein